MIKNYLTSFSEIIKNTQITNINQQQLSSDYSFKIIIEQLMKLKKDKGTLFLLGNGGSSGIISHASTDFLKVGELKAVPLTDNSQLTCMANDYGYEYVFSKPLEIMAQKNDIVIAISSSGSSMNIINAANMAKSKGCYVVTYSGFKSTNQLRTIGDVNFWLNSSNYGKVEIGHALLLHILSDEIC